jgi:hypothetical protein
VKHRIHWAPLSYKIGDQLSFKSRGASDVPWRRAMPATSSASSSKCPHLAVPGPHRGWRTISLLDATFIPSSSPVTRDAAELDEILTHPMRSEVLTALNMKTGCNAVQPGTEDGGRFFRNVGTLLADYTGSVSLILISFVRLLLTFNTDENNPQDNKTPCFLVPASLG